MAKNEIDHDYMQYDKEWHPKNKTEYFEDSCTDDPSPLCSNCKKFGMIASYAECTKYENWLDENPEYKE